MSLAARLPVVASLTPRATERLWSRLVSRPPLMRNELFARAGCRPLRAVFYTETDWLRLATALAENASPCAQYYISIPPLAADKMAFRSGQAWRIRALGTAFHALAEIHYAGWSRWVAAGNGSWYDAGVEARRRMAAAGFDVGSGDSWALNELSSGVRQDEPGARQAVEDFVRGLYDGGGAGAPTVKGVLFDIGYGQSSSGLTSYKASIAEWLLDAGFWQTLSGYVSDFSQEVFGDVRDEGPADASLAARMSHLNEYLAHPLALVNAGPPAVSTARTFLQQAYNPLANAAWSWDSAYGFTDVPLAQMEDYVSLEVAALRALGTQSGLSSDRFGFAWAPRVKSGTEVTPQYISDTGALLDRLAAAIHDSDQSPVAACKSSRCTTPVPGATFTESWTTFATWPFRLTIAAPSQLTAGQPAQLTIRLLADGVQYTAPSPIQITLSSGSSGATFAASLGGPFSSSLTVTIPAGGSSTAAYYIDPTAGTPTLTANALAAFPAHQQVSVAAAPPPIPDLHVALSASAKAAPAVGAPLTLIATVSNSSATSSSAASLQLTLPAGYTVTGTGAASCTGAPPTLTCTLGQVTQSAPVRITVDGIVGHPGEQDVDATVTSISPPEQRPTDNSASLRLLPPALPAPRALRRPRISGTPTIGATVHVSTATWNRPPTRISYRWQICTTDSCRPIAGATLSQLRVLPAFAHHRIRVVVTADFGSRIVATASRPVLVH